MGKNVKRIRELCEQLNALRRTLLELKGKDPDNKKIKKIYYLYPPADSSAIVQAEKRFGFKYPPSYRSFLKLHNGWLGFWPDWSLVGIPRKDNKEMYQDIENTVSSLPDVADKDMRAKLPELEKADSRVILVTNHLILGTDFNGGLLVFDQNRVGKDGEPEIAWVRYVMHVERRWRNFEALMENAISSTEAKVAKLRSNKT